MKSAYVANYLHTLTSLSNNFKLVLVITPDDSECWKASELE